MQDDFFLESQLTPTDESIRFWNTIIENDEALASEINRAQEIICRIPFRKKEISANAQEAFMDHCIGSSKYCIILYIWLDLLQ